MRLDRQRDAASILDALQASEDAIAFCHRMTREDFLADRKTQAAVQHQLLVVGEAINRISTARCAARLCVRKGVGIGCRVGVATPTRRGCEAALRAGT